MGTVDSFQGQVRGINAITLTRSNPQGEIGFLSDIRRMNVGMTRTRRKLLLVGDSSKFCSHPFFGELLAYLRRVGGYRAVRETESFETIGLNDRKHKYLSIGLGYLVLFTYHNALIKNSSLRVVTNSLFKEG